MLIMLYFPYHAMFTLQISSHSLQGYTLFTTFVTGFFFEVH
jgi:hypothetical protein